MTATDVDKTQIDLAKVNAELGNADAADIVRWAGDTFGDGLIMTSSFGAQSAVMLHLVTRVLPDIPVVLIDTGYLFPETYQFIDAMAKRFTLNLKVFNPALTPARQEALHGKLWDQGEQEMETYLHINKVEPMQRALQQLKAKAWLAGLRSSQTDHRASLGTIALQNEIYKVHPVLRWSSKQMYEYIKQYDLPFHPLYEQGYVSIGDTHSTRPITATDDNERDTRFRGLKQECGLHLPATNEETASRDASGL